MAKYTSKAYLSKEGKIYRPESVIDLTPEQALRLGDKVEAIGGEETPVTLEDFTVNELKELAESKGLTGYSKLNKPDLINLVEQGE